jgi:hypothetical protein
MRRISIAAGACIITAIAFSAVAMADRNPDATQPEPVRQSGAQVLNVYEWGTETARWDGGREDNIPFSVPDFYHNATEIDHSRPAPPPRPGG